MTCVCKTCKATFVDPLEIYPGPSECSSCREKRKNRNRQAKTNRRVRHEVYTSLGMKRNQDGSYE